MLQAVLSSMLCSACGEPLGRNGICLGCLLRAGLQDGDAPAGLNGHTIFGDFHVELREDGSLWELGRGAMGVTYRAVDKVLNRKVALKVIEPPTAIDSQIVRERFLREARAAAGLRHPNVAAVFQFGAAENDRCYCAMELVEGETLDAVVRGEGPLPCSAALEIATQVTRALVAAAERGLVHRDLKPGNIMLACKESGEIDVKVIDFGVAKAANAAGEMELTHSGFVGTPAFASPEQFDHGAIDARTDIYALGVTIWFALTGRLPFAGTTIEEIRARQQKGGLPIEQLKARGVPQAVIELLRSCLAINPVERPASARELMSALEACWAQMTKPRFRRRLAFATSACALIALAIASLLLRQKPTSQVIDSAHLEDPNPPANVTDNGQAYLLFLRAKETEEHNKDLPGALELYQQAIALDPKFALARARFSIAANEQGHDQNSPEWYQRARTEAEEALHLQPNLGDAHLALANCYIFANNDANRALAELNRAAVLLPNSAEVQLMAAWTHKLQNKYRERIAALRRAEAIDPRMGMVRSSLVLTLTWVRDWQQALDAFDRSSAISDQRGHWEFTTAWNRAKLEFRLSGNIEVLKQAVRKEEQNPEMPAPRVNCERFELAMFDRDYANAARFLHEVPAEILDRPAYSWDEITGAVGAVTKHQMLFHEALLSVARGGNLSAESLSRAATALQARCKQMKNYDDGQSLADLGVIHAFAGQKEQALTEVKRAIEIVGRPGSIESNAMSSALALVYARTGETDKAIDLIEHLLTVPCELGGRVYDMTLVDLKWRWEWDPLRNNPRFQKLLTGPEPKTIYY